MSSITEKNPDPLRVARSLVSISQGITAMRKHPVPVRLALAKLFRDLAALGVMEAEAPSDLLVVALEHEGICERSDCLVNIAKALELDTEGYKPQ
jgi:hypothetical protein